MMQHLPTAETLDQLEHVWPVDSMADALITRIFETHSLRAVSHILQTCAGYSDITRLSAETCDLPAPLLAELHAYFENANAAQLPSWADTARIDDAADVFREHQFTTYVVMAGAALPECYISRDIASILGVTHRLDDDAHRRIIETLQFYIVIMTPGSLTGTERWGVLDIHKIRLMHAAIRHLIRKRQAADAATSHHHLAKRLVSGSYGETSPINQCVMALTLLSFSYVIVRGLMQLGVDLTKQQQDDYIHTWSVVGHLLGIDDDLLPNDIEQARDLFALLKQRQRAQTEHGSQLERSLLRFTESLLPWYLRSIPRQLTFDLMGEEDCAFLGLGKANRMARLWNVLPLQLAHLLNRRYRLPIAGQSRHPHACEYVARHLLSKLAALPPSENGRAFELPDHLTTL